MARDGLKATVLMPIHDGRAYLRPALESILSQTFRDFEFLIVDDGSSDNSAAIVGEYGDPRIRLVPNRDQAGLVSTLNLGMELARAPYVARMDCDDVSVPVRLARQVRYLDRHPEVGVVGSWVRLFGDTRPKVLRFPVRPDRVGVETLFRCPLSHTSVVLRREFFLRHSLDYDGGFPVAEDWALWSECASRFPMANLPEVLVHVRIHASSASRTGLTSQRRSEDLIRARNLADLGMPADEEALTVHRQLAREECPTDRESLDRARAPRGREPAARAPPRTGLP